MESLFTWCAVIGGSIFALQFLMLILGLESGNDLDFDAPELDIPELDVPEIDVDLEMPEVEAPEASVSLKDGDVDFDRPDVFAHSDGWFVGIVTFRSLVAAVAIFGLTGLAAMGHLPPKKSDWARHIVESRNVVSGGLEFQTVVFVTGRWNGPDV